MQPKKTSLFKICTGHSCSKRFSKYILERALKSSQDLVGLKIETCSCQGNCEKGPTVVIEKDETKKILSDMDPIKIAHLIKKIA